ncbi:MAG TPA: folate-binding protein [Alphaproteobacteria bacterium]|nr:folate-binding protein [Alphaproteobacteria bacterium]
MGFGAWSEDRGTIKVSGAEAESFLQGLISNDITKAEPSRAIYAALLTPQGKFLHDFFIIRWEEGYFLDCAADRRADLMTRLKRYKLRSKVDLADKSEEWRTGIAWGEDALTALGLPAQAGAAVPAGEGVAYTDPRHPALGARLLVPAAVASAQAAPDGLEPADPASHDLLRVSLGIADGARDLEMDRSFLLESGFDELNGIDWNKGCYVGQEVTARTKYRGLVRRRLTPVDIHGQPENDDRKIMADGKNVGELRALYDGKGLALLRLEALNNESTLTCGGANLAPHVPDWWQLPEAAAE